jgi:hypothetical protein
VPLNSQPSSPCTRLRSIVDSLSLHRYILRVGSNIKEHIHGHIFILRKSTHCFIDLAGFPLHLLFVTRAHRFISFLTPYPMAPSEDEAMTPLSDGEDDLFGDDEPEVANVRELSDRELDSGDDEDRDDRERKADEEDQYEREAQIQEIRLMRHGLPNPVDEEAGHLVQY